MNDAQENAKKAEMDHVEIIIGKVMQVGVALAAIVMLVGILMLIVTGTSGYSGNYHPTHLGAILRGLVQFKSYAVIMTGLALLIFTPVLRVIVSIYAFMVAKDKLYVWITIAVLIILAFAMILGMYGV